MLRNGVELNWLPPTEPNGEVHYVIEYKRGDSGNWTSVNTTSDSTHYNLTGLHSGTNYTVRVVAVNTAGRAPIIIATTPTSNIATVDITVYVIAASAAAAILLLLTLLTTGVVMGVVVRKVKQRKNNYMFKSDEAVEERAESLASSREQQEAAAVALHFERAAQQVEDHYECTDALGPGLGELTGVRPAGDYDEIVNRDAFPAKKGAGLENQDAGQQSTKLMSTPKMVYAEVDKSKKGKGKTQGGLHATTPQDLHMGEQHYECSSAFGQDWCENGRDSYVNGQQGDQLASSTPIVVYAEVDKSRNKGEVKFWEDLTTAQDLHTEDQHYECGNVLGEDWSKNLNLVDDVSEGSHSKVVGGTPCMVVP